MYIVNMVQQFVSAVSQSMLGYVVGHQSSDGQLALELLEAGFQDATRCSLFVLFNL